MNANNNRLIPVPAWNKFHLWPSEAGLRYYIYNAEFNGFNKVLKRVGRRLLIDEAAFYNWIEERSNPQVFFDKNDK